MLGLSPRKNYRMLSMNFQQIKNAISWKWAIFTNRLSDIERWIAYRTYDKYHIIKTDLSPDYYDADTRILHSNFNILTDFVENEKGSLEFFYGSFERPKKKWYERRVKYDSLSRKEKRTLGMKFLDWEINNDEQYFPKHQRSSAKEMKELYIWWNDERPKRVDPYDFYKDELDKYSQLPLRDMPDELKKKLSPIYTKINKMEEKYDKEDEKMLIRLMKIRKHLWT